ncbi:MAG: galactokinase [Lachnospiraceae bacterium]|nr:galactokinase [Lachnospiraceae bacterium]
MTSIEKLISDIENNVNKDRIADIYPLDSNAACKRLIAALNRFKELYGESEVRIYSAPGRTEIGGNHSDHQHGEVLCGSISMDAIAVARPNDDSRVVLYSEGYGELELDISDLSIKEDEKESTKALIRGVAAGIEQRGYKASGFTAYVTSDVLGGSGLSSSAAFETLIGVIISDLFNDSSIDAVTIAKIGQFAENKYFGKPSGLMDQTACSVGSLCAIDFKDPEEPVIERIQFDIGKAGYSLCITNTQGSHADLTADYAAVPEEMKKVASYFGKEVLRDVSETDVIENIPILQEKFGDRAVLRSVNFFEESRRAHQQAECLKAADVDNFLKLVSESGDASFKYLQNVYSNSNISEQGVSIALLVSSLALKGGKGVCRVHGGGFAGTIQAFVKNEAVEDYRKALDAVFGEGACAVMKIRKYGGVRVL